MGEPDPRKREGLVFYRPSNGTEAYMFTSRCERCRHFIDDRDDPQIPRLSRPFSNCQWGVLDRLNMSAMSSDDHISNWYDPDDIEPTCPAICKRFTDRNDDDPSRDPPKPDMPGQMFLGDIDIPCEDDVSVASPQQPAGVEESFERVLSLTRRSFMEHGLCEPVERNACAACHARRELKRIVDGWKGCAVRLA